MNQSKVIARIEEICNEFDERVKVVGLVIARLELAKALAESEVAQQSVQATAETDELKEVLAQLDPHVAEYVRETRRA